MADESSMQIIIALCVNNIYISVSSFKKGFYTQRKEKICNITRAFWGLFGFVEVQCIVPLLYI